ncbi:hypothetical protein [Klenkia brasiliensis]|uniref:Beta-lactamase enzyme family protein n=1 Tax=Klenkia brasiliensis TaxID=333142 RepID=A0A1G7ZGY2_9ACTN|nr:hypothetical protein [Klenkia brasiliensis]SDH07879.1 hypothetical protein SAMN05660324_4273 [Klenkia brasiliensis]
MTAQRTGGFRRRLVVACAPVLVLAGALTIPAVGGGSVQTAAVVSASGATSAAGETTGEVSSSGSDPAAVLAEVEAAAVAAGGTIAVTVLDADGDTVLASADASAPVYTASLVKLLVVHQLLLQAEAGDVVLTADDLELMQSAIEASDDDAMDQLWVEFDGEALVADAVETFGLTGTAPPTEAGQWGQTTTTAADQATVLATCADTLTGEDAQLLTGWLRSTTPTAADGFDQTFGLLSPGTGQVAAKQGWMCCLDDTRWLHSTGVLHDGTVVVLLGTFPGSTSWTEAAGALDAAASAVAAAT